MQNYAGGAAIINYRALRGCMLVDLACREYIDGGFFFVGATFTPSIPSSIRRSEINWNQVAPQQLLGLGQCAIYSLARRLVELAPSRDSRMSFSSDDGATAVEVAFENGAFNLGGQCPQPRPQRQIPGSFPGRLSRGYGDVPASATLARFTHLFAPLLCSDLAKRPVPNCLPLSRWELERAGAN